jgi:hypothetical protein
LFGWAYLCVYLYDGFALSVLSETSEAFWNKPLAVIQYDARQKHDRITEQEAVPQHIFQVGPRT